MLIGVVSAIATLTGCGGSGSDSSNFGGVGYSGSTSPAVISEDNSGELADSGVVVTKSLTQSENVDLPFGVTLSGSLPVDVQKKLNKILKSNRTSVATSNLPVGITETVSGECGGSVTYSGSETSFTATFNNYCESGVTISGKMSGSSSDSSYTESFNNITVSIEGETFVMSGSNTYKETSTQYIETGDIQVTFDGETFAYSYTETCGKTSPYDCTYSENVQAGNGLSYRIDDSNVSEGVNGWNVAARLYDPNYGYVEYVANNIQYCTDGSGHIESGSIILTDSNTNVLRVDFNDCTEMTITFGGNADTIAQ